MGYLGDAIDAVTHGQVVVYQVGDEVQVDVHGKCAELLPLVVGIVEGLLEDLSAEVGITFVTSAEPTCGRKLLAC